MKPSEHWLTGARPSRPSGVRPDPEHPGVMLIPRSELLELQGLGWLIGEPGVRQGIGPAQLSPLPGPRA